MPILFQQSRGLDFEVNTATGHNHQALSESLKRDSAFSVVRPLQCGDGNEAVAYFISDNPLFTASLQFFFTSHSISTCKSIDKC